MNLPYTLLLLLSTLLLLPAADQVFSGEEEKGGEGRRRSVYGRFIGIPLWCGASSKEMAPANDQSRRVRAV